MIVERVKKSKSPIIRELVEEIESGIMPDPISNKILQEIYRCLIDDTFFSPINLKSDPNLLYIRIFGRDYVIYQRADNKLEMIEKKFYEILKCKQII